MHCFFITLLCGVFLCVKSESFMKSENNSSELKKERFVYLNDSVTWRFDKKTLVCSKTIFIWVLFFLCYSSQWLRWIILRSILEKWSFESIKKLFRLIHWFIFWPFHCISVCHVVTSVWVFCYGKSESVNHLHNRFIKIIVENWKKVHIKSFVS